MVVQLTRTVPWFLRHLVRAVNVFSGFIPRACVSLSALHTVRMTPFATLIKPPQFSRRDITSFQRLAGFSKTRCDVALAILTIDTADSCVVCGRNLCPVLNPAAEIQLESLVPNYSCEEILSVGAAF